MTSGKFLARPALRLTALAALAMIVVVLGGMVHAAPSAATSSGFGGLTPHAVAPHSDYQYQLRNYNSTNGGNKCLVQHNPGDQGYIFDCNRAWNDQLWHIQESTTYKLNGQDTPSYKFINQYNGQCLTIQDHGERSPAYGYTCTGKSDQDFFNFFTEAYPNEHIFGDVGSKLCLTAQHDTEQSPAFGSGSCMTGLFADEMWDMI